MTLFHATCVSLRDGGALLRGASGAGKSDLALRVIDTGGRLVADDYVVLSVEDDRLVAAAPQTIKGLLEIRGVGVVEVPYTSSCEVKLIVDLVAANEVPRLPEPATEDLAGVPVPRIALDARQASAPAKIRMALATRRSRIRLA